MDVFVSWSGKRSKQVAENLTDWLPQVIQAVTPWMSKDIDKGARWSPEISEKLAQSKIGIICLTPENIHSDWILFEAGALSKIKENKVCTFLIELNPTDIEQPLAQFQHTSLTKDDVKSLVTTINSQLAGVNEHPLPEKTLNLVFEKYWPDLENRIASIPPLPKSKVKKQERSDRELLEEILELTRRQTAELMRREEIELIRHEDYRNKRKYNMEIEILRRDQKMLANEFPFLRDLFRRFETYVNVEKMPKELAREKVLKELYFGLPEESREIPKSAIELFTRIIGN